MKNVSTGAHKRERHRRHPFKKGEKWIAPRHPDALLPEKEEAVMILRQTAQGWRVAEIQGLYGPFTFTERLLQKIWLRGEFDLERAITEDGQPLHVVHPGRWNQLGGPDFRNARLRVGDREVSGDVELHLYAGDWACHAHASDGAYRQVILHVVLFPSESGEQARRGDGSPIPTLVLLPLLLHDLEEYAAEDALETLANRSDWRASQELARLSANDLRCSLRSHAATRWRQKVHFARRRVERLGWEEACHHAALEILGYRFNRVPMLKVAARRPLTEWVGGAADPDALFATGEAGWSLQGVRPANHPRIRLRQYAAWVRARPDWPARISEVAAGLADAGATDDEATAAFRRRWRLPSVRERWGNAIAAGIIGGTRLDNLVCDGFLPLLASREETGWFALWFHWYAGDLPPALRVALKSLGVSGGRAQPLCHGFAQGLLGWMLAREADPPRTAVASLTALPSSR
jgi:hypothetical protein